MVVGVVGEELGLLRKEEDGVLVVGEAVVSATLREEEEQEVEEEELVLGIYNLLSSGHTLCFFFMWLSAPFLYLHYKKEGYVHLSQSLSLYI